MSDYIILHSVDGPPSGDTAALTTNLVNDTAHLPSNKEIVEGVWGHFVPEALKNGTLKPVPVPLVTGKGLEKISEGVALCQQGRSAGKRSWLFCRRLGLCFIIWNFANELVVRKWNCFFK